MAQSLTTGAIARMFAGEKLDSAVLQVIDLRKLQSQNAAAVANQTDRFRLVLSDGVHFQQSMLATQLNHMIKDESLKLFSFIRVREYICNPVQSKKILIVLGADVVGSSSEKVGTPTNIENSGAQTQQPAVPQQQPAQPAVHQQPAQQQQPVHHQPVQQQQQQQPAQQARPQYQPAQNQPQRQAPRYGGGGGVGGAGGGLGTIDPSAPIHPIASLSPYQNRWVIKARVTNKSDRRTWFNARGDGCLFSMDLLDSEGGEIRATAFNDTCDRFFPLIEVGSVYKISRGQIKMAQKRFNSLNNEFEISLDNSTIIEKCQDDAGISKIMFNFVPIDKIEELNPEAIVDVIGIVSDCQPVAEVTSKTSGKRFHKRSITLVDSSNKSIELTLWGSTAQSFSAPNFPVLACKGVRVSDFGGRSLSAATNSLVQLNPDHEKAYELRAWYDSVGSSMSVTNLSNMRSGGGGATISVTEPRKTISQIKDEQLGVQMDDEFVTSAYISYIKHDSNMLYYPACLTPDCKNKKVVQLETTPVTFSCERCGKVQDSCQYRYILSLTINDHTGSQWLSSFNETGEAILGLTAEELNKLKDTDQNAFEAVFAKAAFKPYLFKIKAKTDRYQEESRVKCSVAKVQHLDYAAESKRLVEEIKKLRV